MRVGYLISRYPEVSQTFVLGEVLGLRGHGLDVDTFSIRRSPPEEVLSAADRQAFETTYAVLPPRPWDLLRAHLRALAGNPRTYVGTLLLALRLGRVDARSILWQLFYFAEAMVVWDQCTRRGIRHLHVHFPNVAADVAMLVAQYGGEGWGWSMTLHGPTELFDVTGHKLAEKVRRATFSICISHYMRSQVMGLVEREQWDSLHVLRCGIDTRRFVPGDRSSAPGGAMTVLAVGRLVARKGHFLLVEALARLRSAGVELRVVIVGEGPERQELEALAARLGVTDHLLMPGAVGQDEIADWFRDADVLCLPSFAEGVPIVLMEAMASGLPVVASRTMGIPELVEDGVSGLLVTPGRSEEIVDALAAMSDADQRRVMGAAGRARVLAEFEVGECTRRVAELMATEVSR